MARRAGVPPAGGAQGAPYDENNFTAVAMSLWPTRKLCKVAGSLSRCAVRTLHKKP